MTPHPAEGPAVTNLDKAGQDEIEGRSAASPTGADEALKRTSPAGPHAEPTLTSPDATPGAGALPSASPDDEADAATG